jgi:hypothetical protein
MVHTSLAILIIFEHTNYIIKASKHHSTHGWKIETTHAPKSAKRTITGLWGFNFSKDVYSQNS